MPSSRKHKVLRGSSRTTVTIHRETSDNCRSTNPTTGLTFLPNETLSDIVDYLGVRDLVAVMRSCKTMFPIGARLIYKEPHVSGKRARSLFVSILSKPIAGTDYGTYVDYLSYEAIGREDIYLTFTLFSQVLRRIPNVRSLDLFMPDFGVDFMGKQLDILNEDGLDGRQLSVMPCLQDLFVDRPLLAQIIGVHRRITTLTVSSPMMPSDVRALFLSISHSGTRDSLIHLYIALAQDVSVNWMMRMISSSLPKLRCLTIIQSGCSLKAVVMHMSTQGADMFPYLCGLAINPCGEFWTEPEREVLESQLKIVEALDIYTQAHPLLCFISIPGLSWVRKVDGGKWKGIATRVFASWWTNRIEMARDVHTAWVESVNKRLYLEMLTDN